jgi:hypothetical protein
MKLPGVRFTIRRVMIALSVLFVVALLASARCYNGTVSDCNYAKIENGMTVGQVESVLGTGREIGREYIPSTRDGPVVDGQAYFLWEEAATGRQVWVGLRGGRVCTKWYWEPSL